MNTFTSALAILLCLLPQLTIAQVSIDQYKIAGAIQKSGTWFMKGKNINSVSIGVYNAGQTFTAHFGELQQGAGNSPTDETVYEIASVTKTMASYLVAKAVREGKISLDDPVTGFLDGSYENLTYEGTPITIRHLLTHTSGLPGFLPEALNAVFTNKDPEAPFKYQTLEQAYSKEAFLQDLEQVVLASRPGEISAYSNTGAELVGYILESVYQTDIQTLLKESIWDAAGMENTFIHGDEQQKAQLVKGYWMGNTRPSPNFEYNLWCTGSGVKSSLADMLQYLAFQLEAPDAVVSTSREVLHEVSTGNSIAYFWNVRVDRYGKFFHHHGGTGGVQNWLFVFPKYDLGISIITNHSDYSTPGRLSKAAKRILQEIVPD